MIFLSHEIVQFGTPKKRLKNPSQNPKLNPTLPFPNTSFLTTFLTKKSTMGINT